MSEYVCGFLFSWKLDRVVLIKKNRGPVDSLVGKLNGVGGKIGLHWGIRGGETTYDRAEFPQETMQRKFYEETGTYVSDHRWHCFYIQTWAHTENKVYYFVAFGDEAAKVKTVTDEEVKVLDPIDWWADNHHYDLPYLLEMVLTHQRKGDLLCLDPEGINGKFKAALKFVK